MKQSDDICTTEYTIPTMALSCDETLDTMCMLIDRYTRHQMMRSLIDHCSLNDGIVANPQNNEILSTVSSPSRHDRVSGQKRVLVIVGSGAPIVMNKIRHLYSARIIHLVPSEIVLGITSLSIETPSSECTSLHSFRSIPPTNDDDNNGHFYKEEQVSTMTNDSKPHGSDTMDNDTDPVHCMSHDGALHHCAPRICIYDKMMIHVQSVADMYTHAQGPILILMAHKVVPCDRILYLLCEQS